MTKKNNKMKMVKDPKTGKMVPEFAVKKAEGKTVKKKMMAGGKMVKSLKGSGVNPAVTSIPNQEKKLPFVENLSFKKLGSSYPYNSKILIPISLKKT